jgi:hypothetical protein
LPKPRAQDFRAELLLLLLLLLLLCKQSDGKAVGAHKKEKELHIEN